MNRSNYRHYFGSTLKWLFIGSVIGAISGTASALLLAMIAYATDQRKQHEWLLYLLPLGGVFIGWLYMTIGKQAAEGNNLIFDGIHGQAKVLKRMGPIVFLGTFLTHLFGGSTGREGAAIQMGGSIAKLVELLGRRYAIDGRILLMCGISGGFGSAFGTPVSGAVFGMEVSSGGKLHMESLIPCVTASFVGHYVATAWGIHHDHFVIQQVPELTLLTFIKVAAAAFLFGGVSVCYSQLRNRIQFFTETRMNHALRGGAGGIIIVALVWLIGSRDYTGRGLEMVQQAFEGTVPPLAFLAKLLFTAVTMGTGFVGGEAIPLFFIGSTLGNTLSFAIGLPASFLAAIGLIAVFCGGANTPIACFLLAMEMFEGSAVPYFFLACMISYLVSGPNGVWPSQRLYKPKSAMLKVEEGHTIKQLMQSPDRRS